MSNLFGVPDNVTGIIECEDRSEIEIRHPAFVSSSPGSTAGVILKVPNTNTRRADIALKQLSDYIQEQQLLKDIILEYHPRGKHNAYYRDKSISITKTQELIEKIIEITQPS